MTKTIFSLFIGGIVSKVPAKNIDLKDFIKLIKSDRYKNQIQTIRICKDKDRQGYFKSLLDFCIPSGTFTTRATEVLLKDKMKEASGILSLDVDEYTGNYTKLKEVIKKDEYVYAVFDSPRQKLKIFINVPPEMNNDLFWRRWFEACKFFGKRWGCEFDELKDITRACFVSWDENAYCNVDAKLFEGIADIEEFNRQIKPITYDALTKGIEKGNRNEALFSLGCSLMHKGVEPAYIEELLKAANKKNTPPLSDSELQRIFKNIFNYRKEETKEESEDPEIIEDEIQEIKQDIWFEDDKGKKKLSHLELAKSIIKLHNIVTIGKRKQESYYYNGKIFSDGGVNFIGKKCQELTDGKIRVNDVNEVIAHIQRTTSQNIDVFNNAPLNLIPFENGVYDLDIKELLPHDPKYNFTFLIPHKFDISITCPKIEAFLLEVLGSKEEVKLAQEFIGYCLYRKYFIKKAWIIKGDQDTGKTTLINLINIFVGNENTSGVSLHKVIYDKFAASRLYSKLLNFYDDLPMQDLKDTGAFKIATGGGFISGEKKFGDSFEFMNYAKFLFATNYFIILNDKNQIEDMAYYGRYLITLCENVFDKKTMDRDILEKMTTPEEMSGLINFALEGLQRLLENGSFTYSRTPSENQILMEKNSNSIVGFIQDCVMEEEGAWLATNDLYEAYLSYCHENTLPKESKDKFSKVFSKKATYVLPKQHDAMVDSQLKKNLRGYINVAFHNNYNTFFKTIYKFKYIDNKIIKYNV